MAGRLICLLLETPEFRGAQRPGPRYDAGFRDQRTG